MYCDFQVISYYKNLLRNTFINLQRSSSSNPITTITTNLSEPHLPTSNIFPFPNPTTITKASWNHIYQFPTFFSRKLTDENCKILSESHLAIFNIVPRNITNLTRTITKVSLAMQQRELQKASRNHICQFQPFFLFQIQQRQSRKLVGIVLYQFRIFFFSQTFLLLQT